MSSLYREHILDHYAHPRNAGRLVHPDISSMDANKNCGDEISVDLIFGLDNTVNKIAFLATGCAISVAAASLLSEVVVGKTVTEIIALGEKDMHDLTGIPKGSGRIPCMMLSLAALQKTLTQTI